MIKEKVLLRKLVASVLSLSFITSAFAVLIIQFNYDDGLNKEPVIYQFDYMPTDYLPIEGSYIA